ncbi:MAG TPA: hypothetical protein VD993_04875 [Chitinophagaceae bacterium]|nr:hypothetical protein [Chitinophagaceae bacterium]
MHVVLQFPIVDFRSLLEDNKARLKHPSWPRPDMKRKPFLRKFGRVNQRNAGGSDDWSAEEYYCNARLSIRYSDLHKHGFPVTENMHSSITYCYRRFYSDGYFMNKAELGFIDNVEAVLNRSVDKQPLSLAAVLKYYVNLPVEVAGKKLKIYKAGEQLAQDFCDSTTVFKLIQKDQHQYVVDGELCITLIYHSNENVQIPTQAVLIKEHKVGDEFIRVYGYKLHNDGYYMKAWIIEIPRPEKQLSRAMSGLLRNLRINLMRIHAEKETIRILLNGIKSEKVKLTEGSKQADLVDSYLEDTSKKLFKKKRANIEQADMLDFALQSEDVAQPGSFSSLETSIHYFKDLYTRKNVDKLLEHMSVDKRKTILFLTSSPSGKNTLDFGKEFRTIMDAWEASVDRGNYVKPDIIPDVKKAELMKVLDKHRPDYLHISLHASETDGLYFQDDAGKATPMSAAEFAQILKLVSKKKKPQVIILSACNSKAHAEAVKEFCGYAMGTTMVFPEKAGVVYARCFYETLFNENSTDIPYCHDAAVLGVQQKVPPFSAIEGVEVHTIPVLVNL